MRVFLSMECVRSTEGLSSLLNAHTNHVGVLGDLEKREPVCLSVSLFLSVCLSASPLTPLSLFPCVCLSICLSACLSVCLPVCLSVCLSVSLSLSLSLSLSFSPPPFSLSLSFSLSPPSHSPSLSLPPPPPRPPSLSLSLEDSRDVHKTNGRLARRWRLCWKVVRHGVLRGTCLRTVSCH